MARQKRTQTPLENFLDRLLAGETNRSKRLMFAEILTADWGSLARNEDTGRWEYYLKGLGTRTELALGLDAWDQGRHCVVKVTHDLDSFYCWDVTGMIEELRLP